MNAHDRPLDAVTFDFWDTLCVAGSLDESRAGRLERLRAVLAEAGASVDDAQLHAALKEVGRTFDEHWLANRQYTHRDAVPQLLKVLDVELEEVHALRFTDSFTGASSDRAPALTPHAAETLQSLKDRGVRLGIVCDVGLSPSTVLRRHLAHHGVLDVFDHVSFSDEVGAYKPAPEIFEHALGGLGADPSRAAHVGDLRRTDIAGAQAFGMTAVRYRGVNDDTDAGQTGVEGDHVIDDHADLLSILGLVSR